MSDYCPIFSDMALHVLSCESSVISLELFGDETRNRKVHMNSMVPSLKVTTVTTPKEFCGRQSDVDDLFGNISGSDQECESEASNSVLDVACSRQAEVSQDINLVSFKKKVKNIWNSESLLSPKGLAMFKKQMPAAPGAKAEIVSPKQPMPKKLKSSQNHHDAHFKATKKWSKIFSELRLLERHEACYRQRVRVCEWNECPVEKNGARRISAHRAYCCSLSAVHAVKRIVLGAPARPKLVISPSYFGQEPEPEVVPNPEGVPDPEVMPSPDVILVSETMHCLELPNWEFESEISEYRHKFNGSRQVRSVFWKNLVDSRYLKRPRASSHPESVTIVDLSETVSAKDHSDVDSEDTSRSFSSPGAPEAADILPQADAISRFAAYQKKKTVRLLICATGAEVQSNSQVPSASIEDVPDLAGYFSQESTPKIGILKEIHQANEAFVLRELQECAPSSASLEDSPLAETTPFVPYDLGDYSPLPSDESIASEVFEDLDPSDEESCSETDSQSSLVSSEEAVGSGASHELTNLEPQSESSDWSVEDSVSSNSEDSESEASASPKASRSNIRSLRIPKFQTKRFVNKLGTISETQDSDASMKRTHKSLKSPKLSKNSHQKFFMQKSSQIEEVFASESKEEVRFEASDPIFEMDSEDFEDFEDIVSIQKKSEYELFDTDCWVRDPKSKWWHDLGLEEFFIPKLATGAGIDLKCVCINLTSIKKSNTEIKFNSYVTNMKFKLVKCSQEALRLEQPGVGDHQKGSMDKSIKGGYRSFIEIGDIDMTVEFNTSETVLQQYELMCAKSRSDSGTPDAEEFCTQLSHMKAVILAQDKIMGKCQENLLVSLENYDLIEKYMHSLMANIKAAAASFYNHCVDIGNHEKTGDIYGKLKSCFSEIMNDLLLMGKMEASIYQGIKRIEVGFTTKLEHILGNYEKAFSYKMVFHESFRNAYKKFIKCGDLTNRQFDSFIGCESDEGQAEFLDKCRVDEVRQILSEKLERLKTQHQMVRQSREELQSTFEDISSRFLAQVFE